MNVRRSRRGITIIEVMVLMTAVAVMLGMCVILLQLALRLETDARGRFERATVLNRLAERFRADVHGARSVDTAEAAPKQPPALRVESSLGRSIEYRVKGTGEVSRVETEGEKVVHRETFQVPQTGAIRLELRELDGRRFAVLSIDELTRPDRIDPTRTLEILALVGKNSGAAEKLTHFAPSGRAGGVSPLSSQRRASPGQGAHAPRSPLKLVSMPAAKGGEGKP